MGERYLAIVNPAAGGGRCGKQAPEAVRTLREAGLDVVVEETRAAGDATRIAREGYRQGIQRFIAVGGDGTGFEIVNGLLPEALGAPIRPSLGFLPLGTGNSFLRDFSTEGAAYSQQALLQGKRRPCDVIRLKHREGELFYINLLSLGFIADACTLANRRFKRFGEAGYGMAFFALIGGLAARPIPYTANGGALDDDPLVFVSFCNSRFTGGKMMMAPSADTADGKVDIIVAGKFGRFALTRAFAQVFDGSHVGHPLVRTGQASSIEFRAAGPMDAMIDGEVITLWPERLDVLHNALEVCV
jgi:YegS/Rv2252/BmrU family lipid kinase